MRITHHDCERDEDEEDDTKKEKRRVEEEEKNVGFTLNEP